MNDVDENALKRYRNLREKVNPAAEELSYTDNELLEALGCLNRKQNRTQFGRFVAFGTTKALRTFIPCCVLIISEYPEQVGRRS